MKKVIFPLLLLLSTPILAQDYFEEDVIGQDFPDPNSYSSVDSQDVEQQQQEYTFPEDEAYGLEETEWSYPEETYSEDY